MPSGMMHEVDRMRAKFHPSPIVQMMQKASRLTGVSYKEIVDNSRRPHFCWVRFGIMLAASNRGFPKTQIGARMKRDHSTICHGVARGRAMLVSDPAFAKFVSKLA